MRSALLMVLLMATLIAFYFVWMNRASEKIISAVIPIGIAALTAVGLTVFVFGGQPPVTVKFPAVFLYQSSDRYPFTPPSRPLLNSLFEVPELHKNHPDRMLDETSGATLYHHLLQKAIFDVLVMHHSGGWETEINRFDMGMIEEMSGPSPDASAPSLKLSIDNLNRLLKGNRFGDSRLIQLTLSLPPGTHVEVRAPEANPVAGEEGEIVFENDYVRLSIKTRFSSRMSSLGPYRLMLGYTWEKDREFQRAEYLITVKAEFSRLRSGHPDMPKYKHWIDQIVSELQNALDEQAIWAQTKSNYFYSKQLQQFGAVDTGPDRPLTLSPPEFK
jgi:hypothetical protein